MCVIGVDEAGRGPLVGNVVAAAVMLNENSALDFSELDDSKKLSEKKREYLYQQLISEHRYAIAQATPQEIDELNIHNATLLAMQRAINELLEDDKIASVKIIIDGKYTPNIATIKQEAKVREMQAVIKADSLFACVSAASIIAKVTRDRQMRDLHLQYPQYGFNQHKGYPTKQHREAILEYGTIAVHRQSYRGVKIN